VTSSWRWKNRLIWFLVVVASVLSLYTSYRIINPVVCRDKTEDSLMIKMYDSMAVRLKVLEFRDSSLNERNLLEYIKLIDCTHPYETAAQGIYESGNFSPSSSASVNNLFGFKDQDGYIEFKHWTYSVDFMVKSYQIRNKLKSGLNYYSWIPKSYHQANREAYEKGVRYIELKLRQRYQ